MIKSFQTAKLGISIPFKLTARLQANRCLCRLQLSTTVVRHAQGQESATRGPLIMCDRLQGAPKHYTD